VSDPRKKLLVVAIGLAAAGAVVAWRSGLLVNGSLAERAEDHRRFEAACAAKVERSLESASPLPAYRTRTVYRRTTAPPSATQLATLRLPGLLADHRHVLDSDTLQYECLHDTAVELGGNDFVIEGVEPDPQDPKEGKLVEGVYLVAAPRPPSPYGPRYPTRLTVATDVFAGGPAERAGLRPGDAIVDLDHRGLGEGKGEHSDAQAALSALADGVAATMTVVRDGQVVDLPVRKEDGQFGYRYQTVPVLPPPP
jgi:hypothetical protein